MTHDKPNLSPKIALYEPDIPQNTASIIRTCSCLGAQLEIIEPCGFLFTDKRFKRVVMDYMEEDKIKFYKSSEDFFNNKKNKRVILITTKKGEPNRSEFTFNSYLSVESRANSMEVANAKEYASLPNVTSVNVLGSDTNWLDELAQDAQQLIYQTQSLYS